LELCPGVDPPRSEPEAELLLLKKIPTGREYSYLLTAFNGCDSKNWPVITDFSVIIPCLAAEPVPAPALSD
jgi:hypothetical protein